MDDGFDLKQWHENDGFVGVLSQPFLLTSDWNDLTGRPADDVLQKADKAQREADLLDKKSSHRPPQNQGKKPREDFNQAAVRIVEEAAEKH